MKSSAAIRYDDSRVQYQLIEKGIKNKHCMSEGAKVYRISGYYIKVKRKIPIVFECRALKEEDALEKAFSEIGSRHRVSRDRIFIERNGGIEEVPLEDARQPEFAELESDDFVIYR